MSCDNCRLLEKHIIELKRDILDLEDRRSKERIRFVTEEQKAFFKNIDPPQESVVNVSRQEFEDLLGLVKEIVDNPKSETLEQVKARLQSFIVE